ncbi:MAG: hypothetical protein IKR85_03985 [Clostridia bacterium]|nr:hypothetical protein [Clostridia bacterium]
MLSKDEFFEPSSTGVVISITNDTASEIVLLSLELPPKRRIEINETLSAGRTRSFDTSIEISADALALGHTAVTLRYVSEGRELVKQCLCPVKKLNTGVSARLICALPARAVTQDERIRVEYILINTGDASIQNAMITCADGQQFGGLYVRAGDWVKAERFVTCAQALDGAVLKASAVCESAYSGQSVTVKAEMNELAIADENIRIYTAFEKNVSAGSRARLTVNIENSGNTAYSNLYLSLNGNRASGAPSSVERGGFISINAQTGPLFEDTEFILKLQGISETGDTTVYQAEPFTVNVAKEKAEDVRFAAGADPRGVLLELNNADAEISDVRFYASDGTLIRRLPGVQPNMTLSVLYETDIYEDGETLGFYALYLDSDGLEHKLESGDGRYEANADARQRRLIAELVDAVIEADKLPLYIICLSGVLFAVLLTVLIVKSKRYNAYGKAQTGDGEKR